MKKSRKIVCSLGVSICLIVSMNKSFASTGKVNVEAVRIRAQANTTSAVLDVAYEDDNVEIVGETGDWYKVSFNGVTGYASKEFITNEDGTTSVTSSENKVLEENNQKDTEKAEESTETTQTNTTEDKTSNDLEESEDLEDLVNKTVKVSFNSNLNLSPTLSSIKVASIKSGDEVKVIYDFNNWIKVEYNSNLGWLPKAAIKSDSASNSSESKPEEKEEETENTTNTSITTSVSETKKGYINVETANVRESASKTSSLINTLDEFDVVTILEEDGDWYKIESGDINGYISKSLITVGTLNSSRSLTEERLALIAKSNEESSTNTSDENSSSDTTVLNSEVSTHNEADKTSSSKGQEVVDFANQYLGYQYVLGGKSPETGFDCSGFTKYVFKNFGYTLGSVAADQTSSGREVSREELQPGDLLLFYDEGKTRIGHVGIYMGNDEFIHAANSKRGVVIDTLSTNSYYNSRYVTARRIVE